MGSSVAFPDSSSASTIVDRSLERLDEDLRSNLREPLRLLGLAIACDTVPAFCMDESKLDCELEVELLPE